jgi:kinesin family protein C2/C3
MFEMLDEKRSLTSVTLEIRNKSQLNGLNVPDASMMPVRSTEDVMELMKVGQRNRAVGATALNERSSRSHRLIFPAVVMFYIFLVGLPI